MEKQQIYLFFMGEATRLSEKSVNFALNTSNRLKQAALKD